MSTGEGTIKGAVRLEDKYPWYVAAESCEPLEHRRSLTLVHFDHHETLGNLE